MTTHVATFSRDPLDCYGDAKQAKIYKMEDGRFAISLYTNGELASCEDNYISYGAAVKVAIEWLDNSEFHM